MGVYKQGANGAFSGKAGSVIGSNWKKIDYIRGLAKRRNKKPPTERQLEQQMRFRLAVTFLKPLKSLVNVTCASLKDGRATGFNMVLKQMLAEAVVGVYPALSLSYPAIKISYGSLDHSEGSVTAEAGGIIKASWEPNLAKYSAFADDEVTVVVYDPISHLFTYSEDGLSRSEAETEITVRNSMIGRTLHVWYFFNTRDSKTFSPSFYAGQVVAI